MNGTLVEFGLQHRAGLEVLAKEVGMDLFHFLKNFAEWQKVPQEGGDYDYE